MDFGLTTVQLAFAKECADFAKQHIAPHIQALEDDIPFRKQFFQKMAKQGLFMLCVPKEHGGNFTDTLSYLLALEAIAKVDAGISVAMAVTNMVAEAIDQFGSIQQKAKYLPKIASGECVPLSFALTERTAGSDAKAIKLQAAPHGNGFMLNGEKQLITNGDLSGALIVFARDSPESISAFLIDQGTSGFTVTKKERKLGLLTANLVTLHFEQCAVSAEHLLGKQGEGLKIAFHSLDRGRIGIAAQSVGIAEAAFETSLRYAKERHQFGHSLADNQAIAFKLADMQVKLSASRLMAYRAAWLKDQGKLFSEEAAEAKLFCSEACNQIATEALQIHGGYGYLKDYPVEKYFRDARVTTLYEGTSEIQRIVISRYLLESSSLPDA